MRFLLDSCVWAEYFAKRQKESIENLLNKNAVVTNNIILAELVPVLYARGQHKAIRLLCSLPVLPLSPNWFDIIVLQSAFVSNGLNGIGLLDIQIALQAASFDIPIFTFDKHFFLMQKYFTFDIYTP